MIDAQAILNALGGNNNPHANNQPIQTKQPISTNPQNPQFNLPQFGRGSPYSFMSNQQRPSGNNLMSGLLPPQNHFIPALMNFLNRPNGNAMSTAHAMPTNQPVNRFRSSDIDRQNDLNYIKTRLGVK